uniref:Uncharacterized protein n=1 Tax=Anguilla anguilla TaxID=7936 RepID=A0A0E9PWJ0_ANGAN
MHITVKFVWYASKIFCASTRCQQNNIIDIMHNLIFFFKPALRECAYYMP